jgi:hypothetical protein
VAFIADSTAAAAAAAATAAITCCKLLVKQRFNSCQAFDFYTVKLVPEAWHSCLAAAQVWGDLAAGRCLVL